SSALDARGVACAAANFDVATVGFEAASAALAATVEATGAVDAIVVALAGSPAERGSGTGWEQVLGEHTGIVEQIYADAAWARAAADYSAQTETPIRLVTLTDAMTAGGRSRAQASAQHARAARGATDDRIVAFTASIETLNAGSARSIGEFAAHLLCSPETPPLSGAELVASAGFVGLRSHPRVGTSVIFDGSAVPAWLDDTLESIVGARGALSGNADRREDKADD
ncbi:MAG: hypothetical protein IH940_12425, partial [Acidobacteria bacterium]|nr:hypothetical protein [Acidobacteriota bacterium]